jgi:hypothetical protein
MRSGRLHVAAVNAGGNPTAVNCAGLVPFAMMAAKDGSFGYEMEIIVPADSPAKTPADLKGRKMAFTAPTSNSGYKAPVAILEADYKLVARKKGLRARVLRKARQLDPRRGEQGLRFRGGCQLCPQAHARPQGLRSRENPLDL